MMKRDEQSFHTWISKRFFGAGGVIFRFEELCYFFGNINV